MGSHSRNIVMSAGGGLGLVEVRDKGVVWITRRGLRGGDL